LSHLLAWLITQELGCKRQSMDKTLLFSVPSFWSFDMFEQLTKIAFEDLNCPHLILTYSPLCALFAIAKDEATNSCLVVDIGHSKTEICAVIDNMIDSTLILDVGGYDIEQYLHRLLPDVPIESCREVKESIGVASVENVKSKSIDVNGKSISVGAQRSECINVLFQPHLNDKSTIGLAEGIATVLSNCSSKKSIESVLVCGSGASFKHFWTVLSHQLQPYLGATEYSSMPSLQPAKIPGYFSKIEGSEARIGFIGAQLLAQLAKPGESIIAKHEYQQKGPIVCHEKILF
jgi:actin-related protein